MPINVDSPLEITFKEQIKNELYVNEDLTPYSEIWSLRFSPDGSILAWQCEQTQVKLMKWSNDSTNSTIGDFLVDETECCSNRDSVINQRNKNIAEISCGETIWSLAFGSTKPSTKHKRMLHKPKSTANVNKRFQLSERDEYLILAVGLQSGKIKIYQIEHNCEWKLLFNVYDHKGIVNDVKFTKDGSFVLASTSRDGTIKFWNMFDDGNLYKTLTSDVGRFYAIDWSSTAPLLCAVGSNKKAIIFHTETFNIMHNLRGHINDVVCCEFSPDGMLLATGSYDTKVCLWNSYSGELLRTFYHLLPIPSTIYLGGYNPAYVKHLKFGKSIGCTLLTFCDDKKIRLWSLSSKSSTPAAECVIKNATKFVNTNDGLEIIVGTKQGHLELYQVPVIINRLSDICRTVINQYCDHKSINKLGLPLDLENFLFYENIKEKQHSKSL